MHYFISFRQMVGQKKWWFFHPDQTAYLKPSINVNGFSAHTRTFIGKPGGEAISPWVEKLVRYTTVLNPGDVLINPPWFWHAIINQGSVEDNELVIGSPSRYGKGVTLKAAFKSNTALTLNALWMLYYKYGLKVFDPNYKLDLQKDIADNRRNRGGEELQNVNPLDASIDNAD